MLTETHPLVAVAANLWTVVMRSYAAEDGSDPATCPPPTAATIAAWINANALDGEPLMWPRPDIAGGVELVGDWCAAYNASGKLCNLADLADRFDDIPNRAA